MAYLGKTFHFVSEENFDNFVEAMNIEDPKIKAGFKSYKPSYKLEKSSDGSYTLTMTMDGGSPPRVRTFTPGVEFKEPVSSTTTSSTTVTVAGDKFTTVQKFDTGDNLTTVMEFSPAQLKVTMSGNFKGGAATAIMTYKA